MRDLKGLWRFAGDFLQTFSNGSSQRALINKCAYWGHLTAKSCETSTNGWDRSESAAAPSSQREAFAVTARSRARLGGLATPCSYWLPLCSELEAKGTEFDGGTAPRITTKEPPSGTDQSGH